MKKLFIILFLILVIFIACKNVSNKKREALKMYEYTPLALLMLDMYDKSADWKEAILKDSFDIEFPKNFQGIYTIKATDSTVRNEQFNKLATTYLKSLNDLVETKKNKKQVKKYNANIDACIACHQVFCQGPIDKINKLYIKD